MTKFLDKATVGGVKETKEGYLVATSRVARTGVQEYLAKELGDIAADRDPNSVVRVYRHADQVFHKDSLASITRLPVTIGHPEEDVTADNWAKLAVGEIGDAYSTEPEWIVVNPMLKDADAVKAARTTHPELSMGYSANIVKARDGLDADFEVTDIRYNHIALVPKARAGEKARIGDNWGVIPIDDSKPGVLPTTEGGQMAELKTVVLGDSAVQVAVADAAAIDKFKAEAAKALKDAKALTDSKDEEIGKLKAELVKAQDAAKIDVDALVAARTELVAQVKAIDSAIEVAGKSDAALRSEAVAKKLGDAAVAGVSEAEVKGMFKVLAKDAETKNPVADAFKSGVKVVVGDAAAEQAAYAKSVDFNAWRDQ